MPTIFSQSALFGALLLAGGLTPATGQAGALDECARYAADHYQDVTRISGVELEDIDVSKAIDACHQAVESAPDDPAVLFQYARSLHAAKRFDEALAWYEKAAGKGYAPAQNNVGMMYFNGEGLERNYTLAFKWYEGAAKQAYPPALYQIGMMYANGFGVEQDYAEAMKWLQAASDKQYLDATYQVAMMYYGGLGVPRDKATAYNTFAYAGMNAHVDSTYMEAIMLETGDGVEQHCGWAEVALHAAARGGHALAQKRLNDIAAGKAKFCERAVSPADAMAALLVGLFVYGIIQGGGDGGDSAAHPQSDNLGSGESVFGAACAVMTPMEQALGGCY
ncbi:tetratricopeptide repeat protein [Mesorhizobium mediterraneum]|uniref:tetratricopeptide repeat protein n=1 Tax=Mesorhizobium mediterraneum TaxID=43617 RepID=UPI00177D97D3|nr:tetratricopeptide repeat protein [Mesorhizobium mediterraneum]